MANSSWNLFKNQTTIHGFSEYGGIAKRVNRVGWVLIMLGAAAFCLMLLSQLCIGYFNYERVVSVSLSDSVPLPDISIMPFPHPSLIAFAKTSLDPVLKYIVLHGFPGGIFSCIKVERMTDYQIYDIIGTDTMNDTQRNYLLDYKPTREVINNMTKAFAATIPKAKDMFSMPVDEAMNRFESRPYAVISGNNGQIGTVANVSVLIGTMGAKYLLNLANFTTEHASKVTIWLSKKHFKGGGVFFGDESGRHDHVLRTIGLGRSNKVFDIELLQYSTTRRYCETADKRLKCVNRCILKTAISDKNSCVPYWGDFDVPARIPVCGFRDYEYCTRVLEKCSIFCKNCKRCVPCEQTVPIVLGRTETADEGGHSDPVYRHQFLIVNPKNVQVLHSREAHTITAFIAHVGGIMGLCFGVSLLSIAHFLCFACRAAHKCWNPSAFRGQLLRRGETRIDI